MTGQLTVTDLQALPHRAVGWRAFTPQELCIGCVDRPGHGIPSVVVV